MLYPSFPVRVETLFDRGIQSLTWEMLSRLLIVGIFMSLLLEPIATNADSQQTIEFELSVQPLAKSLKVVARKFRLKIAFFTDDTSGLIAPPLVGNFSASQAFNALLENTALEHTYISDSSVVVRPRTAEEMAGQQKLTGDRGKNMGIRKGKGIVATVIGFLIGTSATQAVSAEENGASFEVLNRNVIEEVIVTATKRDTLLKDTAGSITALTSDELSRQGIENFDDFSRQTPGLVLSGGKNFNKFTIRGIQTTTAVSSNGEQKPVAVYIDEVPVSTFSVLTPDLRLYDIERVEVLRGPQGTSFGSGSLAGGVRIITKKANLDGFDTSLRVDGTSVKDGGLSQRYSGMVNFPLVDNKLALRLVGYVRDEEGYVDNVGTFGYGPVEDENSSDEWGLRASLRWKPSENLGATLSVMHDDIDGNKFASFTQPSLGRSKSATFLTEKVLVETNNINVTIEYDLNWASLVSSTTYASSDTDWDLDVDTIFGSFMPLGYSEAQEQRAIVQELRLVSETGGKIDWLAGLFYLDRETDYPGSIFTTPAFLDSQGIDYSGLPHFQSPGVDLAPSVKLVENTESAAFGELTYHLTDTLSVTGGLRYTEFEFTDTVTTKGNTTDVLDLIFGFAGGIATASPTNFVTVGTGKKSATTAKFTLNWRPNDDRTFYFTASEGFRRSHPNSAALIPDVLNQDSETIIPLSADSDSLWNYELGAKTSWMDGRLQANIAAYYIVWDDIQLSSVHPSKGPYVTNSGDVESTGIETELLAWPTDNLQLGLNLTFAQSEIVSLSQLDALISGELDGSQLAAPEIQVSGFVQYTWQLNNDSMLYTRLDIHHMGGYPNGPPNTPGSPAQAPNPNFAEIGSYENVNAQIGWETDRLAVVLYGENIFDNDDDIFVDPTLFSSNRYTQLRPRTVGLRLDWRI